MSWMELRCDVECPHCGSECSKTGEFSTLNGDDEGIDSGVYEEQCWECDKRYWYSLRVNFETEVSGLFKKKPKGLK